MLANEDGHDMNLLAAFAEGRLDEADRRRAAEHLAACPACRETLAVLARDVNPTLAVEGRPRFGGPWRWIAVAAALVIAAAWTLRTQRIEPPPATTVDRSSAADRTLQPPEVAAPPAAAKPPAPKEDRTARRTPGELQELSARRGAERTVAGRAFHLVAGEWIDAAYDPLDALPSVTVSSADDRQALLTRLPALKPFADLGNRVTVVYENTVYRFVLPSP